MNFEEKRACKQATSIVVTYSEEYRVANMRNFARNPWEKKAHYNFFSEKSFLL